MKIQEKEQEDSPGRSSHGRQGAGEQGPHQAWLGTVCRPLIVQFSRLLDTIRSRNRIGVDEKCLGN